MFEAPFRRVCLSHIKQNRTSIPFLLENYVTLCATSRMITSICSVCITFKYFYRSFPIVSEFRYSAILHNSHLLFTEFNSFLSVEWMVRFTVIFMHIAFLISEVNMNLTRVPVLYNTNKQQNK